MKWPGVKFDKAVFEFWLWESADYGAPHEEILEKVKKHFSELEPEDFTEDGKVGVRIATTNISKALEKLETLHHTLKDCWCDGVYVTGELTSKNYYIKLNGAITPGGALIFMDPYDDTPYVNVAGIQSGDVLCQNLLLEEIAHKIIDVFYLELAKDIDVVWDGLTANLYLGDKYIGSIYFKPEDVLKFQDY